MNKKDNNQKTGKKNRNQNPGPAGYLRSVYAELGKVSWPSRRQVAIYTGIVIACTAFVSIAFWGIDSGVLAGLKALLSV